jgi:hypothetical protein
MKNRPNKPGLYWWEDHNGCFHVAEFNDDMETIDTVSCDWMEYVNPEEFEDSVCFIRWVSPAHPPKKVKSFECRHRRTTYCDTRKAVLLDDVKEYLLEEQ